MNNECLIKRLANTEHVLARMCVMLREMADPLQQHLIDKLMNDYFDANSELSSTFDEIKK